MLLEKLLKLKEVSAPITEEDWLRIAIEGSAALTQFTPVLTENPVLSMAIGKDEAFLNELLLAEFQILNSECRQCSRASSRFQVTLSDGLASQGGVLVVTDEPSWLDDMTGTPLTGLMELKGSAMAWDPKFEEKCSWLQESLLPEEKPEEAVFSRGRGRPAALEVKSRLLTPGQILMKSLVGAQASRQSFLDYTRAREECGLPIRQQPPVPKVFVTSLARCYGSSEDAFSSCLPWLDLEYVLLKPKVSVFLGARVLNTLTDRKGWKNHVSTTFTHPKYGLIYVAEHPRDILAAPEGLLRTNGIHQLTAVLKIALARAEMLEENVGTLQETLLLEENELEEAA